MNSRELGNGAAAGAGAAAAAVIVIAIMVIWLTIKAIELIARTLVAHPENVPLRIGLGCFAITLLAAGLTAWQSTVLDSLAGISFLALVMICKVLEVYYAPVLEQEWDRDAVAQAVLHEPWWQAA